jgi:adenosylmethionine-8-amino-7-oxononanoate aminotransferase
VACAAALKNIEIMQRENLIEHAHQMGRHFLERLRTLEYHPTVGEVRGTGLWTAIDFTLDKKKKTPFPPNRLIHLIARARGKGLLIKMMGQALEFAPPLIVQKEEIDEAVRILDECINEGEKDMGVR